MISSPARIRHLPGMGYAIMSPLGIWHPCGQAISAFSITRIAKCRAALPSSLSCRSRMRITRRLTQQTPTLTNVLILLAPHGRWCVALAPLDPAYSLFLSKALNQVSLLSPSSSGRCKVRTSVEPHGVASRTKTPLLAAKIRTGKRCLVSSGEAVSVSFDRRGI